MNLENERRRGLLGQGSILTVTSYATRTSPVLRGKWLLENILGTRVPPPPADVPELPEHGEVEASRLDAGADGAAFQESGLLELPPPDGSPRFRAGELRRHRQVA